MGYDVDYDYQFAMTDSGFNILPDGLTEDGNLYVLPSGRYLPPGVYRMDDGSTLIYEPRQLDPMADILACCTEE